MIAAIFNAGRVRRWHKNPDMSWTDDYNDAHQGRVARILLALHPSPSIRLIAAALTHDDGEAGPGDMRGDAKRQWPELRDMVRKLEAETYFKLWKTPPVHESLSTPDREWLKFADSLDAYMWMIHKAPQLAAREDWYIAAVRLLSFAELHGVSNEVKTAMREKTGVPDTTGCG